jgi:hypothetical protein
MRRLLGLCVLAVVLGCAGGSTPKKKQPDGGGNDATGTTDVGGVLDRIAEAPGGDTPSDMLPDDGGTPADAPPDAGPSVGDSSPDTIADVAGEAAAGDAGDAISDTSDAGETAPPRMVGFSFTGTVVTVAPKGGTGLPLGFDATVRTAPIAGSLSYDPKMVDTYVPANRGVYGAIGGSTFTMTVKGKTVTGSDRAQVEVEDGTTSDTFRFRDGPQPLDNTLRIMKLDGVDAPKLSLFIALSGGDGSAWTSDKLPDPFPAIDLAKFPHTFSLEDDGGTLLMQLDTLTPK